MELADWGAILVGAGLGVLLASIMHSRAMALEKRRRRERGVLHSVGERARPEVPTCELRTDPKESFHTTFTETGAYKWIVHSEYHLSLWLLGEWLQYWPTKSKFRWRHRTYTGNVEAFIREQLEKHERQVIFE